MLAAAPQRTPKASAVSGVSSEAASAVPPLKLTMRKSTKPTAAATNGWIMSPTSICFSRSVVSMEHLREPIPLSSQGRCADRSRVQHHFLNPIYLGHSTHDHHRPIARHYR